MSEIDRMQQDAIDRAREMYSRRTPSYNSGGFPSGESFPQNDNDTVENNAEDKPQETAPKETTSESFLDTLLADKERTLIILLLALLNEEKANTSLMLALLYIIM